jgi:hypothetical protein
MGGHANREIASLPRDASFHARPMRAARPPDPRDRHGAMYFLALGISRVCSVREIVLSSGLRENLFSLGRFSQKPLGISQWGFMNSGYVDLPEGFVFADDVDSY